jgi:homoserine kinase
MDEYFRWPLGRSHPHSAGINRGPLGTAGEVDMRSRFKILVIAGSPLTAGLGASATAAATTVPVMDTSTFACGNGASHRQVLESASSGRQEAILFGPSGARAHADRR